MSNPLETLLDLRAKRVAACARATATESLDKVMENLREPWFRDASNSYHNELIAMADNLIAVAQAAVEWRLEARTDGCGNLRKAVDAMLGDEVPA